MGTSCYTRSPNCERWGLVPLGKYQSQLELPCDRQELLHRKNYSLQIAQSPILQQRVVNENSHYQLAGWINYEIYLYFTF